MSDCDCPTCSGELKTVEEMEDHYNNHPDEGVVIDDETILFYAFSNYKLRKARVARKNEEVGEKPVCEWDMSEVAKQIVGDPEWLKQ